MEINCTRKEEREFNNAVTREIQLTQGRTALVDADDYERINAHKWCCTTNGYAHRTTGRHNGKRQYVSMHEEIAGTVPGMHVDHINGDKLDDRKSNLRIVTVSQNLFNRGPQKNNTSGFKGVTWDKGRSKWAAQISLNGHHVFLGYFDDKVKAAEAHDEAVRVNIGEFGRLNFSGR